MTSKVLLFIALFSHTSALHYMPGVQTETFERNDEVPMKVNALTSMHTQVPRDYYKLPFCQPTQGVKRASENLGEFMTGQKIQNSPYIINMLREVYCQILCQVKLSPHDAHHLRTHIKYGYHNNWIVDNLPSATQGLRVDTGEKLRHYAGGFPIGSIRIHDDVAGGVPQDEAHLAKLLANRKFRDYDAFVYNHVNIILDFHQPNDEKEGYRVVGFAVEPMSIKHQYLNNFVWDGASTDGFTKPLQTCPLAGEGHLERDSIAQSQIVKSGETILYTYEVTWNESPVKWASRWDVYLTEDHLIPAQVHWYSITNSIFIVLFLSILIASILVRNLRRDIAGYNALSTMTDEEREEAAEESGWKLIHADVFRPPSQYPMLLCVFVGSGVQLAMATFASIIFGALGFLSPARRGSFLTGILVFYILCGFFAGYFSSRLYKSLRGRQWQLCTMVTALFFPGVCFAMFTLFNIILAFMKSSGSTPFLDMVLLVFMWCGVSVPLVFGGSYVGYKQANITFPTVTSSVSRQIPEVPIYMDPKIAMFGAGVAPFAAAYVELFFIMTSLWMDQFYYVFGFTLIVFLILLITCSEVTMLLCYFQLCTENHRWWWYSFVTSGSTGFYLFLFSWGWFKQLEPSGMMITYMLYFGYMSLISFATFLVTGMCGFLSCFWFTRKIFGTIKVD
mmetsp:Transcript_6713/g.8227  ORF Transcript_6713/g.8227 Transcript_6713/m.8227 type:complete len:675 (-) Transcript_6713:349-2373(-)